MAKVVLSCGHLERGCALSTMAGRRGGDESRWEPSAQKGRAAALRSLAMGVGMERQEEQTGCPGSTSSRILLLIDPG